MDFTNKKLLVLGGVVLAKEIVKHAQARNIKVYVTDYLEDSPAKKIADASFMVSAMDVDAVTALIKHEKIDGIITGFVDSLLPYYAMICEKANLPCYGTLEQFAIATNKKKFKQLCREYHIPTVVEYDLKYPFDNEAIKVIEYPVLIKPVDNSGARGVFICNNEYELKKNYPLALTFSNSKSIIIEKYMNNNEATINYVIQDGNITLCSMADRYLKNKGKNTVPIPVGYTFPSIYLTRYQNTLNQRVIQMIKAMGIKNGIIFIQSFVENGECIFYEMGYRLTGAMDYKITNKIFGINTMDLMINFALSGKMDDKDIKPYLYPNFHQSGLILTFCARPATIGKIVNLDEVNKIPGVLDIVVSHQVGETIEESDIGTLKQVVFRVFAVYETKQQMIKMIEKITSMVDILSIDNESIMIDPLDVEQLLL